MVVKAVRRCRIESKQPKKIKTRKPQGTRGIITSSDIIIQLPAPPPFCRHICAASFPNVSWLRLSVRGRFLPVRVVFVVAQLFPEGAVMRALLEEGRPKRPPTTSRRRQTRTATRDGLSCSCRLGHCRCPPQTWSWSWPLRRTGAGTSIERGPVGVVVAVDVGVEVVGARRSWLRDLGRVTDHGKHSS